MKEQRLRSSYLNNEQMLPFVAGIGFEIAKKHTEMFSSILRDRG